MLGTQSQLWYHSLKRVEKESKNKVSSTVNRYFFYFRSASFVGLFSISISFGPCYLSRSVFREARDGAVVRALASHQCGPGSNPGVDAICGLSLLLVLLFSPLLKNQHFQIPIRPGFRQTRNHSVDVLPPNNNLFIYFHCAPDENDRPSEQTV